MSHGRQEPRGPRSTLAVAVAAVALAVALLIAFVLTQPPAVSGDTVALTKASRTVVECLERGIRSDCDRFGGMPEGAVAPYPVLSYGPAVLLTQLGVSDDGVLEAFELISLVAFLGLLVLCAVVAGWTGRPWTVPLVLATLLCSPLLYYARSTFGESLAALLMAALAAACLRRWPPVVVGLLALLATLSKETVFPFVLAIGALGLWATPVAVRPLRRGHWIGLGAGIATGVATHAAFNWFRYRQLTNETYEAQYFRVPGIGRRLELSVGQWIAPNGGVALFWPLATVVLIACLVIGVVALRRAPRDLRRWLPALGIAGLALLQTGVLASWWAPFGWIAWGPRLMLPLLPALVLLALALCGPQLAAGLRALVRSRIAFAAATVVVVVLALPNTMVLHNTASQAALFAPDATCTSGSPVIDPGYYYGCLRHYAWGKRMVLVTTVTEARGVGPFAFAVVFAAAAALLAAALAAEVRRDQGPANSRDPARELSGTGSV